MTFASLSKESLDMVLQYCAANRQAHHNGVAATCRRLNIAWRRMQCQTSSALLAGMLHAFTGLYSNQPMEYKTYRRFKEGLHSNMEKLTYVMPWFPSEYSTSHQWLEAYERRAAAPRARPSQASNPAQRQSARPSQASNPAAPRPSQSPQYLSHRSRDAQYEGRVRLRRP